MKSNLKLIVNNAVKAHPRPVETRYYHSVHDRPRLTAKVSHSVTPSGALRAAITRVSRGEFKKALICDVTGLVIFTIAARGRTVTVTGRLV